MPPQEKAVARSLEAESWGVSPWHRSGAWRSVGCTSLTWTVSLGRCNESTLINIQTQSFSWNLTCWESVSYSGWRFSTRVHGPLPSMQYGLEPPAGGACHSLSPGSWNHWELPTPHCPELLACRAARIRLKGLGAPLTGQPPARAPCYQPRKMLQGTLLLSLPSPAPLSVPSSLPAPQGLWGSGLLEL